MRDIAPLTLDGAQQAAARSDPRRPLLVLAGPGSGKTALLVERVALLLDAQRHARHASTPVVALTFTRNAARELADRLRARLGDEAPRVDVRTFHSFGLRLLRDGWARDYLGWPHVRVATRAQMAQAADAARIHVGLDVPLDEILEVLSPTAHMMPDDASRRQWPQPASLGAARLAYRTWLHERGLIDVPDMLRLPVAILHHHPDARADLQRRVGHVVSDEGQDWTRAQAALVAYAGGPRCRITAVGDPAQGIFGGSTPRYLVEFPRAFPHTRVVSLTRSYRLHAATLALANAVAAHLPGATTMRACTRDAGPRPRLHLARSVDDEADWIARELQALHVAGTLRHWGDAVALVRTHRQRQQLVQRLRRAGLPCRMQASTLADTPLVTALVAWLTLLRDGTDSAALLRAVAALSPGQDHPAGLPVVLEASGPWTMERLHRQCPAGLSDSQRRELGAFVRLYDGLVALSAGRVTAVVLDAVLERSGLQARLKDADVRTCSQVAALRALVAEKGDGGALEHQLADDALAADQDGPEAVRVSTVHAFKGKEAEVVFVAGLDEGLFPHRHCLEHGPAGLQQELRAFYVALTRARRLLYLSTTCASVRPHASGRPSRFLHLIPPHLLQRT